MKKLFCLFTALALVLGLSGCGQQNGDESTGGSEDTGAITAGTDLSANEVVPAENMVLIKDGILQPSVIEVSKDTTVTWVNQDSDKHWIASDPHPIHDGLKGFDSQKGLAQGESFQFEFDKVGTFSYHDDLNLSLTGKVIVKSE